MRGDDVGEKRLGAVIGPAVREIERACIGVRLVGEDAAERAAAEALPPAQALSDFFNSGPEPGAPRSLAALTTRITKFTEAAGAFEQAAEAEARQPGPALVPPRLLREGEGRRAELILSRNQRL